MTLSSSMPSDGPDDATILRYLEGRCEPAELALVERWLNAAPAHRAELAALQIVWSQPPAAGAGSDDRGHQMWQWLSARMDAPVERPVVVPTLRLPRRSPAYLRTLGLIAAVLVLVVGALALRSSAHFPWTGLSGVLASASGQELVTPRGARVTSNLPDGSRIVLAPESRVLVPAAYAATGRGLRDVYLQSGEAFFQVTHDAARPFRVHTANAVVEDLGTEFVVTAYADTKTTRAVVASGAVTIRSRDDAANGGATLRAGDLGLVDAAGAKTLRRNIDVAAYTGWTKGKLVFDSVPLSDAVTTLGRWYDLQIQLADTALARRRFTATFEDESFAQVLRVLEVTFGVRGERLGPRVVLQPLSR